MTAVINDFERCYRASVGRDARYDGVFFIAVTSTRIYCRPSCPARKARRENVRFYSTAAAAQAAGFRACKRCRPDASPGSPEWNWRADNAARAMRLIADGIADREGVPGLARRLAISERNLRRLLTKQLGAGPSDLARAQRARTALLLIESTSFRFTEVALAAGFKSVRQFNETVRHVFDASPTELRRRAHNADHRAPGAIELRLGYRAPFDGASLMSYLEAMAVPGLEEVVDGTFRRALALPHGSGFIELTPAPRAVRCRLRLDDLRDLAAAVARCRDLLDLDADPIAVDEALTKDPLLRSFVQARPGLRAPGSLSGEEIAVRAILGQHMPRRAVRAHLATLVRTLGTPLPHPLGGVTHLFPSAPALASADPASLPGGDSCREAIRALATRLSGGELLIDSGVDRREARDRLLTIPGIRASTVETIAMRGFHDPDAFPLQDNLLLQAFRRLSGGDEGLCVAQERWRPWRSYAAFHMWTWLDRQRPGSSRGRGNVRHIPRLLH